MWPLKKTPAKYPASAGRAGKGQRDALGRPYERFESGKYSLEFMSIGADDLRPLVLIHSLEYPGWPPVEFCEHAAAAGFRVIALRRPGFGGNAPLPNMDAQSDLVAQFLAAESLTDVVVISSGTGCPVGHRLALADIPQISFSVFANCGFNADQMAEFQPEWFAKTLEQGLTNIAGARLSLIALKSSWGIFGRNWVHQTIMKKTEGDVAFLNDNPELVTEVIDDLHDTLEVHTFMVEIGASLKPDPLLADGCFEKRSVMTVTGIETSGRWKRGVESEAERLGQIPVAYLPRGDMLTIYQSPQALFAALSAHL